MHSRRGIGYRELGTCRQGGQWRKCPHACARVEFHVDGSRETRGSYTGVPRRGKRGTLSLSGTARKRRGLNPISRGAFIV